MMRRWLLASLLLAGCRTGDDPDDAVPPIPTSPTGTETHPAVAFNGTEYLVTWNDELGIYGARVSTSGELIDSEAFVILAAPPTLSPKAMRDRLQAAVASNGTDFFVAWSMPVDDKTTHYAGRGVTAAGEVLPVVPIASPGPAVAAIPGAPGIASNGTDYLVVWNDPDPAAPTQRDIVTAPIVNGVLGSPTVVGRDTLGMTLSAASNGDSYLVAWDLAVDWTGPDDEYATWSIKGVRVTDQSVDEVAGLGPPGKYWFSPSVASNGSDYFVAWGEFYYVTLNPNYGTGYDTRATRVSTTGVVQDSTPIALSGELYSYSPVVAATSNLYVAVISDAPGTAAVRISDGVVQDPTPIPIASDHHAYLSAAVTSDGTSVLAAWATTTYQSTDIYMSLIAGDGTVGPIIATPPIRP